MEVALSCDHRVVYGAEAARFLQRVRHLLEHPVLLVVDPRSRMAEIEFREAVRSALDEELERDERVIFFGEDVAAAGGVFAVTPGLAEKYGATARLRHADLRARAHRRRLRRRAQRPAARARDHVRRLPGAVDGQPHQPGDEVLVPLRRATGLPLVIRSVVGAGGRFGAIHSQMPVSWVMGVTGLKIVAPSTPADAKGLLKAAIRDDNPVLFFEHKRLYPVKGEVNGSEPLELSRAAVVREGEDVTLVSAMKGSTTASTRPTGSPRRAYRPRSSTCARCAVRPRDRPRLGREDEPGRRRRGGALTGGWAGEVLALVTEEGLGDLDDAWRIATAEHPDPLQPAARGRVSPGCRADPAEVLGRP